MVVENQKMESCCCCKPARAALIVWGYIKMILILLGLFPLYIVVVITAFYGSHAEGIQATAFFILYVVVFIFDIVLIVASHTQNMKALKLCFWYLILECVAMLLIVPWSIRIALVCAYSTKEVAVPIVIGCIIIFAQGILSILGVKAEINKLNEFNSIPKMGVVYAHFKNEKNSIS